MSDTPNETVSENPPLQDITISSDLAPREGETTIADVDAIKILEARFSQVLPDKSWRSYTSVNPTEWGGATREGVSEVRRDLLARIVRMIPIESRTPSVMQYMDIRPILQELMLTKNQAEVKPVSKRINGVPVGPEARVEAGLLLVEQNKVIEDEAIVVATALEAQGEFKSAADRQAWIDQVVHGWRDENDIKATPALAKEAMTPQAGDELGVGQQVAAQQLAATEMTPYDQFLASRGLIEAGSTPYTFMSADDVRWMFGMEMVDWNRILESEANKAAARAGGQADVPSDFTVDTGGLLYSESVTQAPSRKAALDNVAWKPGTAAPAGRVRLLDVMNELNSSKHSAADIRKLQQKLVAAGYIEEEEAIQWSGMATDPATQQAWSKLVQDSVKTGKSMMTLLAESTNALRLKEEEEDQVLKRDMMLSSSVGLRESANSVARQVLGRNATNEEAAAIIQQLHSMQRKQGTLLNDDENQFIEDIDIEAEIETYLRGENEGESGAYDLTKQFQTFEQIARRRG